MCCFPFPPSSDLQGREEPEPAADDDDTAPQQPQQQPGDGDAVVGAAEAGGQPGRRLHGHRARVRRLPRPQALPLPLRDDRHPQGHGLPGESSSHTGVFIHSFARFSR